MNPIPKNKKGGVVTNTIMGIGGLIIGVIVILVVTSTLLDANLLGAANSSGGMLANDSAAGLAANFTTGIDNVSQKLTTILLIVAVVFLFGALVLLVKQSKAMGVGTSSSL